MLVVEKAVASDFEEVYPLLLGFNQPSISKDTWKNLFVNHWQCEEDGFGFVLRDDGKIVGYIGLILSKRLISGKEYKFCDMTSWIVKEEYRKESLRLLGPTLALKDYHFTNLSSSDAVFKIMKTMRFKELETEFKVLLPTLKTIALGLLPKKVQILINDNAIFQHLNASERRVFEDHQKFPCTNVLILRENAHCLLIGNLRERKGIPFFNIHHLSDTDLFIAEIASCFMVICLKARAAGLVVDARFLRGKEMPHLSVRSRPANKLFKSPTLTKEDIDGMYSENIVLGI